VNPFTRSVPGLIGLVVLTVLAGVCLLTLPWTMGRAEADRPPRYNEGSLATVLLPPFWLPLDPVHHAREIAQLNDAETTLGRRPTPILGTDALGRSVLIRCLAGGGISIGIGLSAAAISVIIGTLYGTIAAFVGGRTEALMMRIVDVIYGLPYILLVVLLAVAGDALIDELSFKKAARANWLSDRAAQVLTERNEPVTPEAIRLVLEAEPETRAALDAELATIDRLRPTELSQGQRKGLEVLTLLVAIGGVSWLTMARVIRGQVLSLKNQPFVEAARAIGAPFRRQFFRHLLPNLVGPIVVYATLTVPAAILQESFLSFLGIGVTPPLPSWGNLAAEGLGELNTVHSRWWLIVFPCLLLALTLLALNFVGEGLREAIDPKRRERGAPARLAAAA
jgi:ABC-type dipeptide/oligopeptide/nickel transport system permease subunit